MPRNYTPSHPKEASLTPLKPVAIHPPARPASAFRRYMASMHRSGSAGKVSTSDSYVKRRGGAGGRGAGWLREMGQNCEFLTKLIALVVFMIVMLQLYRITEHYTNGTVSTTHNAQRHHSGWSTPQQPGHEEYVPLTAPDLFTRVKRMQMAVEEDADSEHNIVMRQLISKIVATARDARHAAAEKKRQDSVAARAKEQLAHDIFTFEDTQLGGSDEERTKYYEEQWRAKLFRPREYGITATVKKKPESDDGKPLLSTADSVVDKAQMGDLSMKQKSSHVVTPVYDCQMMEKSHNVSFERFPAFTLARGLPDDVGNPAKIGIVTQLSLDRLPLLVEMAERWRGPISCAVLVRTNQASKEGEDPIPIALHKKRIKHFWKTHPIVHTYVSLHLLVSTTVMGDELYPVNHLRNFALDNARSDYLLLLDIDFVTSAKALPTITSQLATLGYPTKMIFVIPAFEPNVEVMASIDEDILTTGGTSEKTWPIPPDMKSALELWTSTPPMLVPFHGRGYKRGHGFANYTRWFHASRGFGLRYNEGMEPYVVVARASVPYFQEIFWGYGLNKVSWHTEMHCAGYKVRARACVSGSGLALSLSLTRSLAH